MMPAKTASRCRMSPALPTTPRRTTWTSTRPIRRPARLPGLSFCRTRDLSKTGTKSNISTVRRNSGKFDAESYLAFNKSCETLLHTLKANIGAFSANDFQQAQHFVEDLRARPNLPGIDFERRTISSGWADSVPSPGRGQNS